MYRALGKQTYFYSDHRQGVHIGLLRRFCLRLYGASSVEKLGGAVTDRGAVVGGRSIDRVDVLRD